MCTYIIDQMFIISCMTWAVPHALFSVWIIHLSTKHDRIALKRTIRNIKSFFLIIGGYDYPYHGIICQNVRET